MKLRRFFISLIFLALMAFAFVACSGTKDICPAYSSVETEIPASPNS